jgi:hypothetical protein
VQGPHVTEVERIADQAHSIELNFELIDESKHAVIQIETAASTHSGKFALSARNSAAKEIDDPRIESKRFGFYRASVIFGGTLFGIKALNWARLTGVQQKQFLKITMPFKSRRFSSHRSYSTRKCTTDGQVTRRQPRLSLDPHLFEVLRVLALTVG